MGIVWPRVDGQHVFHGGDERAVGIGRDHPTLSAMGLENVFLSVRPIVESLARSTMWSSTTFFSNSQGPARPAFGRLRASQGNQLGFLLAVEDPRNRRRRPLL